MKRLTLAEEKQLKLLETENDIVLLATLNTWNHSEHHIVNVTKRRALHNLSVIGESLLTNSDSDVRIYKDEKAGDLITLEAHHDAVNEYLYRELKDDVNREDFTGAIRKSDDFVSTFIELTKPLYWRLVEDKQLDMIADEFDIIGGKEHQFAVIYDYDEMGQPNYVLPVDSCNTMPIKALQNAINEERKTTNVNEFVRNKLMNADVSEFDFLSALKEAERYVSVLNEWQETADRLYADAS